MQPNTSDKQFSEQTLRQVAADSHRALIRGRYCLERSRIDRFRCVDDQPESHSSYGRQLWYFDGQGVNELDRRNAIYGAVEYSIQYGLHELVEDGVFEAPEQRDRFRHVYGGQRLRPSWREPAQRFLIAALVAATVATIAYLLLRLAIAA